MNAVDIEHLNDLLHRMREEDPEFRVFGSNIHKYCLGPPLSESELQAFEQLHSVTLPNDFRFFLKEAGNGGAVRSSVPYTAMNTGAGPCYGVLPLGEAVIECDLNKPFPLLEDVEVRPFPEIERWGDKEKYPGVLQLGDLGCASYDFLVVNGPAYGTMWSADLDLRNFKPVASSFDSWYGKWMKRLEEHALPCLANERVIKGVRVGMTKAEIVALCGEDWEYGPIWGGKTFLKFKHLSTEFKMNEEEVVERIITHAIYP